ncbi:MAG: L,D-transpeptidase family protein [Actinomycetales bacterium]|nr:L,D-transpeptidase family protein [Actinomycetales bacterium]
MRGGVAAGIRAAVVGSLVLALAACSPSAGGTRADSTGGLDAEQVNAAASPTVTPPKVSVSPAAGSTDVRLDRPVVVRVRDGRLSRISLRARDGKATRGRLNRSATGWKATGPWEPSTAYRLTVVALDVDGGEHRTMVTFRTLTPQAEVSTTVQPWNGQVVGVGMPVTVTFSHAVTNRKAAQAALTVRSTPSVVGAWRWTSSTQVQWRPRRYWPAGTRVTVSSDLRGVQVASGTWGTTDDRSSFRIGSAMVSTVDIDRHAMTVRRNGAVIRRIPITTGKKSFETRNGIKVIMTRERKHRMDARSTGIEKDDPEYYNLVVDYAMRLTWSGEFLHAAPWSAASHGSANVSHGCTGMSMANAKWLYDHSTIGDVVEYKGGRRPLEWGNGITVWNRSFADWSAGS